MTEPQPLTVNLGPHTLAALADICRREQCDVDRAVSYAVQLARQLLDGDRGRVIEWATPSNRIQEVHFH